MDVTTNYIYLLKKAKKIRTHSIVGIVLFCTLVFIPIALILALIDGVVILSTNWVDQELKDDATIWGILALVIIANIAGLVFANKVIDKYSNPCQA